MMFVLVLFFLMLCMGSFVSCDSNLGLKEDANTSSSCIEMEKQALLSFKANLVDINNNLSNWGSQEENKDCCKWRGVSCNIQTHHVIRLDLSTSSNGITGKISPSLPLLQQLEYLDLSRIDFQSNSIPNFLGSLANLRHLDLSASNLSGRIPHQLANLSNLYSLDLSRNSLEGSIPYQLANLSNLYSLDLSQNSLEGSIPYQLANLSNLYSLDLSWNALEGSIPYQLANLSNLYSLYLSRNSLEGSIPQLANLSNLYSLDLSWNSLEGSIPYQLANLSNLYFLDLSWNSLEGSIPYQLANLSNLYFLDLSRNSLEGSIPNFPFGILTSLTYLDLSKNQLNGSLPNFSGCSSLSELSLGHNSFNGSIPDFTGCQSLKKLHLSSNRLSGNLPKSVGQLSNLESLDVSSNYLKGVISDVHFLNLTSLFYLDMSFNSFAFELRSIPSQLETIKLQSCKLGPSFPAWIQTQRWFTHLDISNAGISDHVPSWFWNLPNMTSNFYGYAGIDLSYNQLEGRIPLLPSRLSSLNLAGNRFSGNLSFLCYIDEELSLLDLSNNSFSGRLPDCWLKFQETLVVLNLSNNTLSGEIPSSLGFLSQLEALYLRSNSFVGELPISLSNCTKLRFADFGENNLSGIIPTWIGERLSNLSFLVLRSNSFYGRLPSQLCWLNNLQVLHLSKNGFSGNIPRCFGNFTAMFKTTLGDDDVTNHSYQSYISRACPTYASCSLRYTLIKIKPIGGAVYNDDALVPWKGTERNFERVGLQLLKSIDLSDNRLSGKLPYEITSLHGLISLNLSINKLDGEVPRQMGLMKSLEILDLSINKFSGHIPSSLSEITYLGYLNLSNNNFSGKIPTGPQLQRFDCSSYSGNPHLYGPPLTPGECGLPPATVDVRKEHNEEEDADELLKSYYIGMCTGFGVGFWGICATIFFNRSCRHFLFASLTQIKDWIYMTVALHYLKLQRKFKRF